MTTTSRSRGLKYGYRSGLEEKIAQDLKAQGIPVRYEELKIKYVKPRKEATYTPDFVIARPAIVCPSCGGKGHVEYWYDDGKGCTVADCDLCGCTGRVVPQLIIETKGRFVTADRLKHIEIKKQRPDLDIRFVFSNSRQRISKTSRTTYASWCEKHGFLYADKEIPASWLK